MVAYGLGPKADKKKYWMGTVGVKDDFGILIRVEFVDGKTQMGPWAIMAPISYMRYGVGQLGTGYGQRYKKQPDGRWLKVEG